MELLQFILKETSTLFTILFTKLFIMFVNNKYWKRRFIIWFINCLSLPFN